MAGRKPILSSPEAGGHGDEKEDPRVASIQDRRRHQRYKIGVLTEIESASRGVVPGITYNISESGALLLTLEPLTKGEDVKIMFLTEDGRREVMAGEVVHDEELGHHMFWKHKIGIEFTEEVPTFLKAEFQQIRRRRDS